MQRRSVTYENENFHKMKFCCTFNFVATCNSMSTEIYVSTQKENILITVYFVAENMSVQFIAYGYVTKKQSSIIQKLREIILY